MRLPKLPVSFCIIPILTLTALSALSCQVKGFKDSPYPTPRVIVTTPGGTQQSDVTLTYQLIEVDGSTSDISLEYSTDGGSTWQAAAAKGGDGTSNVKGFMFPGITRTIVWDSFADGLTGAQTCRIRITATKSGTGIKGTPGETNDFQLQNPDFPVISWVSKPEGTVRQLPLTFVWLLDTPAVPIANYYYGLDENPPTTATSNTSVTIPAPSFGAHTFRVFAQSTIGLNSAILEAPFTADNAAANLPPTVIITNGPSGTTSDNTPVFEYMGSDPDGSIAGYYVAIDMNPPFIWVTITTVTTSEITDGTHTFYVMAQDNEGANSSVASLTFTVSTGAVQDTIYVDGTIGDNSNDGLSLPTAVKTIQRGLDLAGPSGWRVLVSAGTYKGSGNKDLDFGGKEIHLKSNGGAAVCIIDCEGSGRALYFSSGETEYSILEGFTVRNGYVTSFNSGGGIYCGGTSPSILNCTFENNISTYYGGGIFCNDSSPSITNCTFRNNHSSDRGGGISGNNNSNSSITGCMFENNTCTNYGGAICCYGSDMSISNCTFRNNTGSDGGAMRCYGSNPSITDCTFGNNYAYKGGGISCVTGNASITNCEFVNNTSTNFGGGVNCLNADTPAFINCRFGNNTSPRGGGMYCLQSTNPAIINCTFANNTSAEYGGGICCFDQSSPTITNCTFENNFSAWRGGGICSDAYLGVFNSIIWNNDAPDGRQVFRFGIGSNFLLHYCCYDASAGDWGGWGPPDTSDNCIFVNPQFLPGTLRLSGSSPCIDAGFNTYITDTGTTEDLDGNPRIVDGDEPPDGTATVDMGAYEKQ